MEDYHLVAKTLQNILIVDCSAHLVFLHPTDHLPDIASHGLSVWASHFCLVLRSQTLGEAGQSYHHSLMFR